MVATPEDLTVWARALYQGTTLLPEKQKAELLSLVSTKTAKPLPRRRPAIRTVSASASPRKYMPGMGRLLVLSGRNAGLSRRPLILSGFRPRRGDFRQQPPPRKEQPHARIVQNGLRDDSIGRKIDLTGQFGFFSARAAIREAILLKMSP